MEPLRASLDPDFSSSASSLSFRSEGDLPDDHKFSDSVLEYISQILMEEDIEKKSCMFHDPLALQAAEKPFYELLGQDYPLSIENSDCSSNNSNSTNNSSYQYLPVYYSFQSTLHSDSNWLLSNSSSENTNNRAVNSSGTLALLQDAFSDSLSVLEFLPETSPFGATLEDYTCTSEKDEKEYSPNELRGRKNHHREDLEVEDWRSNKQSAVYVEEDELSEMFDKVLLSSVAKHEHSVLIAYETNGLKQNELSSGSNGVKTHNRKQRSKKKVVDLRSLLIQCAQAVAIDDGRIAHELLKQIRQHSSPSGDGYQRLAHYFANALEARLAGTGTQLYRALMSKRNSAAKVLKAYQLYLEVCPFMKISIICANHMILKVAEKAKSLHVIDFGIVHGFQWPILIQHLSARADGPPKLRITGIELPQPGFRPTERVDETGRRLANYCERFNVPFEYNGIAQKWETIRIEDLKIGSEEVLVVNSMFRLGYLLDETIVFRSPRDKVLKLIRMTNPNLFVQTIANGFYNASFFTTRFKEALFKYSALFDMFDATTYREDPARFMFESEFYARSIMNVIACEGTERIERAESYTQWHVRNKRAGFRKVDLEKKVMKKLKDIMKAYHKDFMTDEDGPWVLVGWKGRIIYAIACWEPTDS